MKTITETLLPQAAEMDGAFVNGARAQREGKHDPALAWCRMLFQDEREAEGFMRRLSPLLTPPAWNLKLDKGVTPSYGLTLQHTTTHIRKRLSVNACPHAGDCMKVCVLDNGNGGFDSVQRARRAKTRFLINQPRAFSFLLGYELAMALDRHLAIRWRPNVNSDIRWEELIPSAFDGSVLGGHAWAYDYTKDADRVLAGNGNVAPFYRVSFSWNENADAGAVGQFLWRGGNVAVVTDRKKGDPLPKALTLSSGGTNWIRYNHLVDADKTDEWMTNATGGVIGDLSAKGRARSLIGRSNFVVTTGATA